MKQNRDAFKKYVSNQDAHSGGGKKLAKNHTKMNDLLMKKMVTLLIT